VNSTKGDPKYGPPADSASLRRISIFGFEFTCFTTFANLVDAVANFEPSVDLAGGKRPFLITPNVDDIVNWNKKEFEALRSEFHNSVFVIPDGQPLVWFSKLVGKSLIRRTTGSSLFPPLWKKIMEAGKKPFFILANEKLCRFYENEYAPTRTYHPPFFKVTERDVISNIVKECKAIIEEQQPDFVFVGIQFPKQNILAVELERVVSVNKKPLFLILGSSMEYHAGYLKRSPPFFQLIGMEWFYRFCQQPRRLFKRYFVNDVAIVPIFFRELFKK
jgi:N-acetylglucosaminyldiphosphoundecaprenol N-acetyl-beta-D-mannosaminyltransferase